MTYEQWYEMMWCDGWRENVPANDEFDGDWQHETATTADGKPRKVTADEAWEFFKVGQTPAPF